MPSTSFSNGWKYDVFLNFRGSDTCYGFTGHLYKALCDGKVRTFIDDEELQRGEQITPSLLKAIEESRIFIPVFSNNYASSTFCLDELVHIFACVKKKSRLVFPVFYEVDPSHVRHQTGSYEEALNNHKKRFDGDQEKLKEWRVALAQAANLSGYHFKQGKEEYEYDFIAKIVEEVSQKINRTLLHVADFPVGLEYRMQDVNSLVNIESGGVHMIGIHGVGGVGKSTLARAIYNLIADQFEGYCFLNVREYSMQNGLVHLQKKLLSKTIGEKGIKLGGVNEGIPIIKHRLHLMKILLVLDDVDDLDQLRAIAGGTDWFGSGSRIIITTRDRHLLTCHGVKNKYEVHGLNKEEALKLLTWSAFKIDKVDPCYVNILNRVVTYTSGLPLALEVIGSNLSGKRKEVWESALDQYERIPDKKIQDILKVSFDSLQEDEQKIFLDIACCFKGYDFTYVKEVLSIHHGFCPEYAIGVLIDKSLLCRRSSYLTMHDLIEDMGKEIVRQESPGEPGKRSRLWLHEDIVQVLEENEGTSRIQMIILDCLKYEVVQWDGMAFKEMNNLKTLIVKGGCFSNGPKHLPNSLRVLDWWGYPSRSFPSDFQPKKLVRLQLPYSHLMCLNLLSSNKMFVNMSVLNFNDSPYITEIPNLCCVPNLQKLSCRYCDNLIKIHKSVGFLDKLEVLDADKCSKLSRFPPLLKLTSLKELGLSCCPSLEIFPKILGKMENVTSLYISYTPIKELPFSIQNLTRLQKLELVACGIVQLPSSIYAMQELRHLIVKACKGLLLPKEDKGEVQTNSLVFKNTIVLDLSKCNISDKSLQRGLHLFANMKELYLSNNDFTILPASIKECHVLTKIYLKGCENLQEIRGVPPNLEGFSVIECSLLKDLDLTLLPTENKKRFFLRMLYVTGCKNLKKIEGIPQRIEVLRVTFCSSLKIVEFTLHPAGTQGFHLRREIVLDNCENLQEIKGIPFGIQYFSARDCHSLSSECRSMLLSQELHETGGCRVLYLAGTRIPEWFHHCINGSSISFWFRNNFPSISLGVVAGPKSYLNVHSRFRININNNITFNLGIRNHLVQVRHHRVELASIPIGFWGNKWNRVECTVYPLQEFIKQIGIHVLEQGNNMEDIQFTNPLSSSGEMNKKRKKRGITRPAPPQVLEGPVSRLFLSFFVQVKMSL